MARSALVPCALAALMFWPRTSSADTALQSTGDAALGWTDNVRSAPDTPVVGSEKTAGSFMLLSPGATLSTRSPRVLSHLSYTLSTSYYFQQENASAVSHRLEYRSLFDVSERVGATLGVSVTQSKPYAASSVVPVSSNELASMAPGTSSYVIGTVDQGLEFDVARHWRAWQGGRVGHGRHFHDPQALRTTELSASGGAERTFESSALGGEAQVGETFVDGAGLPEERLLVASAVARFRHDIGRDFSSRFEAGVLRATRLRTGRGFWQPTGAAALGYAVEAGQAELGYSHRVTTNLMLGQALLVDEVSLRGAIPLTRRGELVLGASIGYQRGRVIDQEATLAAHVDVLLADVGIGWQATSSLALGLRYTHFDQRSDASAPPLPLGFVKNTVVLGAGFRFPSDSAMPRVYRSPRRVDRSDEIRDNISPSGATGP